MAVRFFELFDNYLWAFSEIRVVTTLESRCKFADFCESNTPNHDIADRVCCFSINLRNLMDGRGAEVLALRCWARKLLDDPLIDECFGVQDFVIRGFRCTVRNTTVRTSSMFPTVYGMFVGLK